MSACIRQAATCIRRAACSIRSNASCIRSYAAPTRANATRIRKVQCRISALQFWTCNAKSDFAGMEALTHEGSSGGSRVTHASRARSKWGRARSPLAPALLAGDHFPRPFHSRRGPRFPQNPRFPPGLP
jgi:hypothetical protein